ncbi:hypothetical protein [Psychrobacillus sp.]|uniref:hypothetical protein n=1 Tax=Psychrobacillus sp. TaxID=1871623 RepID=UPI0028BD7477|nr:hypothetical protein [Psychrobacillus sp.]
MPEIMIFKEVIEENGLPFTVFIKNEGQHIDGKWVTGIPIKKPMTGVILPLNNDDIKYIESGTYTVKEKKLFTTKPIEIGTQIEYKEDIYTLQAFKDYSEYTDVHIYLMRWREGVDLLD